jgi:acyl-CoA synthetase (AMP-forming)/AMP-acid ligase II
VSADNLRAWASDRLAAYKIPKAIELADALPRTDSGKLLRRELA